MRAKKVSELREIAKAMGMKAYTPLKKTELIEAIVKEVTGNGDNSMLQDDESIVKGKEHEDISSVEFLSSVDSPLLDKKAGNQSDISDAVVIPLNDADYSGNAIKMSLINNDEDESNVKMPSKDENHDENTVKTSSKDIDNDEKKTVKEKEVKKINKSKSESHSEGRKPKIVGIRKKKKIEESAKESGNINYISGSVGDDEITKEITDINTTSGDSVAEKTEPESGSAVEMHVDGEGKYECEGVLELADAGFGFLRFENFLTGDDDVYVSPTQIKRFNLKTGDLIRGIARKPRQNEKFGALIFVGDVNGDEPGVAKHRPDFDSLTPIFPNERISLEGSSTDLSTRLIDLVAPIGKGQRGLIVAAPKAGKTVLLKKVARSIERKYSEMELFVLLVDERPEEVTDMKRSLRKGQVLYSTFDKRPEHHVKVAEMLLARAQRLVEHGKDVVILLDSITRLARAYNLVVPPSGRTLSGGIDPSALYKPKKFFGAARNMEEGGSITILATALVDTGSRMDEVIFEEFKGTGNMELHLDRRLSEKRIFPAIDLNASGTRREDLLMDQEEMEAIWYMRRALSGGDTQEVTELIIDHLASTRNNKEFVNIVKKIRL